MRKAKRKAKVTISALDFCKLWQQCNSGAQFCEATGYEAKAAGVRASHYRRMGVPLKKFPRGRFPHRKAIDPAVICSELGLPYLPPVITTEAEFGKLANGIAGSLAG